ncbi:hypothetical protein KCP78_08615 [Salmonella enterica subsp. enterica]|nr:hypothetical protein KCP78_08615 [Salmonella enterica subsp. enterica]
MRGSVVGMEWRAFTAQRAVRIVSELCAAEEDLRFAGRRAQRCAGVLRFPYVRLFVLRRVFTTLTANLPPPCWKISASSQRLWVSRAGYWRVDR